MQHSQKFLDLVNNAKKHIKEMTMERCDLRRKCRDALRVAEWASRIVLSYTTCPADDVDLADEASTRRLVQTFVLPGLVITDSQ